MLSAQRDFFGGSHISAADVEPPSLP